MMSDPSLPDDLNAINAVKTGLSTAIPAGYALLYSSKQDATFASSGLAANAYVNAAGQILIAYLGPVTVSASTSPSPVDPVLEAASIALNKRIANNDANVTKEMQGTADRFYALVKGAAAKWTAPTQWNWTTPLQFTSSNVFVTGNSQGGLYAELTAKANTLAGATFGAPGIPGESTNSVPQNLDFTNYINTSDPVGNLASDAKLGPDIQGTQFHFGHIVYIGSGNAGAVLERTYSAVVNPSGGMYSVGGAGFLTLASTLGLDAALYHGYAQYAASLGVNVGVSLPNPNDNNFLTNVGLLTANYALLQGIVGNVSGEGSAKFQGATWSQFTKSQGLITSAKNSNGGFNNVLFQSPTSFKGASAGTLNIVQTDLKDQVAFQPDAWKSVQFASGKFNVVLKNTELAQDAPSGILSFDATTGDINIDNSTVILNNIKDLQVKIGCRRGVGRN
jgi:hypothetical protein